jgi:hypothetical protein
MTDFENYLNALRTKTAHTGLVFGNMNPAPADMFNPAARDGALTWVALRMIPVTLVLGFVFQAVA